ncbi:hypothetical protein ASPWEDRAFT_176850 [Aspergillus wentii DTO 134E9]|uniref:Uncharacterized protein n=1 Tax=Aspergillus wentii DTO 134E9 TaxID=1073089 RepID=A0A1L9R5I4_ASPWE|nr:uncharacterized protein ASPWEDRAFT_176850 [Aspergillus wentii DTO 134E9]KAI9925323.1 hypothetical protein MW887_006251 [Aspergillus wentii]OJJ30179.1 hypothetical protein ASPWEDRAFT_176850 [Aspergillus wentii DTO 134E9]
MTASAPTLEPCFILRLYISNENITHIDDIKSGPSRMIVTVTHGRLQGYGVTADVLPGGSDWILHDPKTDTAHIDVRTQAHTNTTPNHAFYIHYTGIMQLDDKIKKFLQGSPDAVTTDFGEHYWFQTPLFETSHPDLKWIEQAFFVGRGRLVVEKGLPSAVEYQICRVGN